MKFENMDIIYSYIYIVYGINTQRKDKYQNPIELGVGYLDVSVFTSLKDCSKNHHNPDLYNCQFRQKDS